MRSLSLLSSIFLSTTALAAGVYVVQPGDVLSRIAQKTLGSPIYNQKTGTLRKILALNPQIKNPDFILPGWEIRLDGGRRLASEEAPLTAPISANASEFPNYSNVPVVASPQSHQSGEIEILPEFSFFRINAIDKASGAQATLLSNLNVGAQLNWKQNWSDSFQTALSLHTLSTSAAAPDPKNLSPSSQEVSGFDLGTSFALNTRVWLDFTLGDNQELLARSMNTTTITLDRLFVPQATAGIHFTLVQSGAFSVGAGGSAGYLFQTTSPNGYTMLGGMAYTGQLGLTERLGNPSDSWGDLVGRVFYDSQTQNTSFTYQTRQDLGVMLGIRFKLGSGEGR
jgi:hypothetical protein